MKKFGTACYAGVLSLLIVSSAFAVPTDVIRYVDPGSVAGGDGTTNAVSGANRAYHSFLDGVSAEVKDLVAADERMFFIGKATSAETCIDTCAFTVSSAWTTDADHYVVITTTASESFSRHIGRFTNDRFSVRVALSGTILAAITLGAQNVVVDGLQVMPIGSTGVNQRSGIKVEGVATTSNQKFQVVKNCIIAGNFSGTSQSGKGIFGNDADQVIIGMNNVIYFTSIAANGFPLGVDIQQGGSASMFNVTIGTHANVGFKGLVPSNFYAVNGICIYADSLCFDGESQFLSSSAFNISADTTTSGGGSDITGATVAFINGAIFDYHLHPTDTAAKNFGANLSANTFLAGLPSDVTGLKVDIDNGGRPNSGNWDAGADQESVTQSSKPDVLPTLSIKGTLKIYTQ